MKRKKIVALLTAGLISFSLLAGYKPVYAAKNNTGNYVIKTNTFNSKVQKKKIINAISKNTRNSKSIVNSKKMYATMNEADTPTSPQGSSKDNPIEITSNSLDDSMKQNYEGISGSIEKANGEVWFAASTYYFRKALTLISEQGDINATVYDGDTNEVVSQQSYGPGKPVVTRLSQTTEPTGKIYYVKLSTDSEQSLSFTMLVGEPPYLTSSVDVTINGESVLHQFDYNFSNESSHITFDLSNMSIPDGALVTKLQCLGTTYGDGSDSERDLKTHYYTGGIDQIDTFKSDSYIKDNLYFNEMGATPVKQSWEFWFTGNVTGKYTYSTYSVSPEIIYWYSYPAYDLSL